MSSKYSKKQWLILCVYSVVNILGVASSSLQNPFYPMIAEEKGVTAAQYGFVFGIFSLSAFIMNPIVGVMISKFGAVIVSLSGLFTIGMTSISFGFVDKINTLSLFLGTSIGIRVFEAIGDTMVRNAATVIVSLEFSGNVEMAFASIQSFASIGKIMGPVIGGALYELGGFYLPFLVVGCLLLFAAFIVLFLPKDYKKKEAKSIEIKEILRMLQTSTTILAIFAVFGSNFTAAFTRTLLEPHLRTFNLSPVAVGSVFLCSAIAFFI